MIELDSSVRADEKWIRSSQISEKQAIVNLFKELAKSSTARKLMQQAQDMAEQEGTNLIDLVSANQSSMLDTTLIRRFSRQNPEQMTYELRSKIYINENHNFRNALLDLAHELTHYVYRETFNPYEHNFTVDEFVKNTVEGPGGEAEAYMIECQVLKELYPRYFRESSNCQRIVDSSGELSMEKTVDMFYRVGEHFQKYHQKFDQMKVKKDKRPEVSKGKSQFISSAWGVPYPVAAVQEYDVIMQRVCENDQRRFALMRGERSSSRSPASSSGAEDVSMQEDRVARMIAGHTERCQSFLP